MVTSGLREGFLGHLVDELSCRESAGFPLVGCSCGGGEGWAFPKTKGSVGWVWGRGGDSVSLGSESFKAETLFLISGTQISLLVMVC